MDKPSLTTYLLNQVTQTRFDLDKVTIIGRHEDCDMVLKNERGASRKHARIIVEDNRVSIMDLGSLNGTLVNNVALETSQELKDGDVIIFDEQPYVCRIGEDDISSQVTVFADKNELGNPDQIRSEIRMIDEPHDIDETRINKNNHSDQAQFDSAPGSHYDPNSNEDNHQNNNEHNNEYHSEYNNDYTNDATVDIAIPATSRPGGDVPSKQSIKKNNILFSMTTVFILFVAVLIALVALWYNGILSTF